MWMSIESVRFNSARFRFVTNSFAPSCFRSAARQCGDAEIARKSALQVIAKRKELLLFNANNCHEMNSATTIIKTIPLPPPLSEQLSPALLLKGYPEAGGTG